MDSSTEGKEKKAPAARKGGARKPAGPRREGKPAGKPRAARAKTEETRTVHRRPAPSMPMYNDGMMNIAIKAARAAGNIQLRAFNHPEALEVSEKGAGDFVTQIDKECERVIKEIISEAFPDHAFLGEEGGREGNPDAEYVWVIDPLDGTTNFIHNIPQFAVSIACLKDGKAIHAVVYDVSRNELFQATRGKGAMLDNRRIRVSSQTRMRDALIGTGFPFRNDQDFETSLRILKLVMPATAGLRRPGSAALDLCWTACGRYDAYWEAALKPWDIAAGTLIAKEAGALVTDFTGEDTYLETCDVVAGTPKIFIPLMALIQKGLKKDE
jgi:myo-inositol-1(or 4)-monophosphatase